MKVDRGIDLDDLEDGDDNDGELEELNMDEMDFKAEDALLYGD